MKLALFDLDKTLLPIDSDHAWGDFCVAQGWITDDGDYQQRNDAFYADYLAGCLDILAYTRFACEVLQRYDTSQLRAMHQAFMQAHICPLISQAARDLVAQYQDQADWQVIIITATNEFVTRPIVAEFGVEHIIATELMRQPNGTWTNQVRGTPSLREGKVERVLQWLAARGASWDYVETSVMYSDSMNDLPLLEHVHQAIATNPDDTLRSLAQERGWDILDLYPGIYKDHS